MASSQLPCPSWVWATGANVHVAKDRSWFGDDYIPFQSFLDMGKGADNPKVVGVGTVILPTKTSPNKSGPESHGALILKHVLHVPSVLCNIIGMPVHLDYNVEMPFTPGSKGTISNISDGRPVAYFKPDAKLFQVRLSGPPVGPLVGPSPFNSAEHYYIGASWQRSERERFDASNASRGSKDTSDEPLTTAEKVWLKENFESEFKLLQSHGLSIYKEEDRKEGRAILRTFMHVGLDDGDNDEGDDMEDDSSDDDPLAHMLDGHFSSVELNWIKVAYGNPMHFMACFGLKFYNDEDCEEAKAIVRAFMANDEDDD